jgi:catechol 2,3-dioxygenase-like lactoylglutathione lyase family enzyme
MENERKDVFSHIGVCVSDLDRSTRFYTEALGFTLRNSVTTGSPFEVLTELPEIQLRANFMVRDGTTVELLCYERPPAIGPTERRPMNQIGITHLSLIVSDLKATVDRIVEHGGKALPQTRVQGPVGDMMFCTDPDGVRIELWEKI